MSPAEALDSSPGQIMDTSRSRSQSMDHDSQQERKRPRLDGGDDFPADEALTDVGCPETTTADVPSSKSPARSPNLSKSPQMVSGTPQISPQRPSKVTINTRPSSAAAQHLPTDLTDPSEDSPTIMAETASNNSGSQPEAALEPVSLSPSHSRSPEIQVAEPEDIDQPSEFTQWTSVTKDTDAQSVRRKLDGAYVFHTFPQARYAHIHKTEVVVEDFASNLRADAPDMQLENPLGSLNTWMEDLLEDCAEIPASLVVEDAVFWAQFPSVVDAVIRRKIELPPGVDDQLIERFFSNFLRLASRFVDFDSRTALQTLGTSILPVLLCSRYLMTVNSMLQCRNAPLYNVLQMKFDDAAALSRKIAGILTGPRCDIIQKLHGLVQRFMSDMQKKASLGTTLLESLRVINRIILTLYEAASLHKRGNSNPEHLENVNRSCYDFCRSIDELYQLSISKQWNWLTIDTSLEVYNLLSTSFQYLTLSNVDVAVDLIGENALSEGRFTNLDLAELALHNWKFDICWKAIKTGRMELRAQGMDLLQTDLISIYHHFIRQQDSVDLPLVHYMVNLLREGKVLQYITSAESHPQLISRCGNVIAFLAVSKAYTQEDTDLLWDFIVENRDPRMVSEMFQAMASLIDNMDATDVGYLFGKFFDFPVNRFDSKFMDFAGYLLRVVSQRWRTHKQYVPDFLQIRFFVDLLRNEAMSEDVSWENRVLIQRWAQRQLMDLSDAALTDSHMREIWEQCTADISGLNVSVTGSLRAIQALTRRDSSILRLLSEQFGYPALVVRELVHTLRSLPEGFSEDDCLRHGYVARIVALADIVRHEPGTLTKELCEMLWIDLFGSREIDETPRAYAWATLSEIAENCSSSNAFIELWTSAFLPRLSQEDYNNSTLRYVKAFLSYQIELDSGVPGSADGILSFNGLDLVWRFVLRSPPDTVETEAINALISFYLESRTILQCTSEMIANIHIALVDRCIEQIIQAAAVLKSFGEGIAHEDDSEMIIVATEPEVREQELRFSRSLLFLRQFLNALKASPRYSPQPSALTEPCPTLDVKGEKFLIKYQAFDGRKNPDISEISIGDLNTAHELALMLRHSTGMSIFTGLNGGKAIDLFDNQRALRELGFGPKLVSGLLIIRRAPVVVGKSGNGRRNSSTHVDGEVSKYFDQLYDLLDLDYRLSSEIFSFLQVFPIYQRVQGLIRQEDAPPELVLPLEKPYKLLYSANALYLALEDECLSAEPDVIFVEHSLCTLLAVCEGQARGSVEGGIQRLVMATLVDCVLLALRVKVPVEASKSYQLETTAIAQYMLHAIECSWEDIEPVRRGPASLPLPCQAFAVLVESSLHDNRIWTKVKSLSDPHILLSKLLLSGDDEVRKGVAEVLFGVGVPINKGYAKSHISSAPKSRYAKESIQALLRTFWPELKALFPETLRLPTTCREILDVALSILTAIDNPDGIDSLVKECTLLLSQHVCVQIVGQPITDFVISGLAKLLRAAVDIARQCNRPIKSPELLDIVMRKYLLPEFSDNTPDVLVQPNLPILKNSVRQELYSLVLALLVDRDDVEEVLQWVQEPCAPDSWEPQLSNERFALRSEAGHAGLRNLSNTCYLNSLFTQLYMNLQFRELILNVESPQRLVHELRKVFANMQSSYNRCVDPSGAVESIRTYDNEAIDIAIQMDVDEFYNLLFDRLESGMPSLESKGLFRSIYGGQLVQQIKSKECEHVSERMEPFSAIQCDIRGKVDLEESLRAYVEGEVMQGDNKYSCSGCDRHVDAVKRACLKDIPDHLIFHLKRFDFDINTMTRCKINDEFAFPETIDMAPYTLENLGGKSDNTPPDMFELVGVLIHSGTAESGHYYSLIRERPANKNAKDSWLQFNDADVTLLEPERLRDYCFGGIDATLRTQKVWSAYMLFYQRVSSVRAFSTSYTCHSPNEPVRLPLAKELNNSIALDNELLVRAYCVQDPSHARFMYSLLERIKPVDDADCSEDHKVEDKTLYSALWYIDQVSSRFKDLPVVEASVQLLLKNAESCWSCADAILGWLKRNPVSLEALILRNPQHSVRIAFATLVSTSLRTLHDIAVGRLMSSDDPTRRQKHYKRLLNSLLCLFNEQCDRLHLLPRGWDEYFRLISSIASLGVFEAGVVLDFGYLYRCLSLIWLDHPEDPKNMRQKYPGLARLKEKGRSYSYWGLVELLATLLRFIEFRVGATDDHELYGQRYSLVRSELALLRSTAQDDGSPAMLLWLSQCLTENYNVGAASRMIETLALEEKWDRYTCATIAEGLESDPASLARPFLHATLVFCQCCPQHTMLNHLMRKALDLVDTIGDSGGRYNVEFIQRLVDLENPTLDLVAEDFREIVVGRVAKWGPALLMYRDGSVRTEASQLIEELILTPLIGGDDANTNEVIREELLPHAKNLAVAIHLKVNEMAEKVKQVELRGQHAKVNGAQYLEALQTLDVVIGLSYDDDSDRWKEVSATTAWLRSFIDDHGSAEEEESEWTQNASDSEDQEILLGSGSFAAMTP